MTPAHLALVAAAALLVCARAEIHKSDETTTQPRVPSVKYEYITFKDSDDITNTLPEKRTYDFYNNTANEREDKSYTSGRTTLPSSCLYDNRWYKDNATVPTQEDCLRCTCMLGALSCARLACKPLPDPLPRRCHVRHRRTACCPELHCPDGVWPTVDGAKARFEHEEQRNRFLTTPKPTPANTACVEGGTVFAAGSAMTSRVACEQCFCLGGVRRCVRPACLPPPPHCAPRPAPGVCCPQRYYCDRSTDRPGQHRNPYDCLLENDNVVAEGTRVTASSNCSECFCLRGEVRCQAMDCAPALAGCKPLLAPGDCCAHQYVCNHEQEEHSSPAIMDMKNSSSSTKSDEKRAFRLTSGNPESSTRKMMTSLYTIKHTPIASATKNHLITTAKVKRKTNEPPSSSQKPKQMPDTKSSNTTNNITTTITQKPINDDKLIDATESTSNTFTETTTEQAEGTVKIVINGTVNCTAELTSTSLPLNITPNDMGKSESEAMPRVPIVNVEAQTYSPNDIITDRSVNGGFDENDTFTINVTSSLVTNNSHSTSSPVTTKIPIPVGLADALNVSKKKKGEYDYDYTEPTLPPSLPNLKIIPFVAADAVVDNEPTKDTLTYPILNSEDKFPVYYPTADSKNTAFPIRREDTYQPTQYPVFVSDKAGSPYPALTHEVDITANRYPEHNDVGVHEFTVSATLGSQTADVNAVTKLPSTTTTFALETPALNLFSPPVETEGGFIPKDSSILNEYFADFPTTSKPPTKSTHSAMQINVLKGECIAADGRHVPGGQSVSLGCQECTCTWVELACAPRACPTPPGCARLPLDANSRDPCCGDLLCLPDNNTVVNLQSEKKEDKADDIKLTLNVTTGAPITEKLATNNITNMQEANDLTNIPSHTATATPAPAVTDQKYTTSTSTGAPTPAKHTNNSTFHDYDEDEDEEEFSFGSVLKLLLSDTYDTTTAANKKLAASSTTTTTTTTTPSTRYTVQPAYPVHPAYSAFPTATASTPLVIGTPSSPSVITESFFKPLPPRPQTPLKISLNSVNRIDHLVLGEATAIKRITPRPFVNKVTIPPSTMYTHEPTRETPDSYEDPYVLTTSASPTLEGYHLPSAVGLPSVGPGLLKLAGCNIYGRMYRVGRIITELSTPCQECWCTELGVQCKPLSC